MLHTKFMCLYVYVTFFFLRITSQSCVKQIANACVVCSKNMHLYRGVCFYDVPRCTSYQNGFDCVSCEQGYHLDYSVQTERKCVDYINGVNSNGVPLSGFTEVSEEVYNGDDLAWMMQYIQWSFSSQMTNSTFLYAFATTDKTKSVYFRLLYVLPDGYLAITFRKLDPIQNSLILQNVMTPIFNISYFQSAQSKLEVDLQKDKNKLKIMAEINRRFPQIGMLSVLHAFRQQNFNNNTEIYDLYVLDSNYGVRYIEVFLPVDCRNYQVFSSASPSTLMTHFNKSSFGLQSVISKVTSNNNLIQNVSSAFLAQINRKRLQNNSILYNLTFTYVANEFQSNFYFSFLVSPASKQTDSTIASSFIYLYLMPNNSKPQVYQIDPFNFSAISKLNQYVNPNPFFLTEIVNQTTLPSPISNQMKQAQLLTFPKNVTSQQWYTFKDYQRIAFGINETGTTYYVVYSIVIKATFLSIDFFLNKNGVMSISRFYFIEESQRAVFSFDDFNRQQANQLVFVSMPMLANYALQYNLTLKDLKLVKITINQLKSMSENNQIQNQAQIIYKYQFVTPLKYEYAEFHFINTSTELRFEPIIFYPVQNFRTIESSDQRAYFAATYFVNRSVFSPKNISYFELQKLQISLDRPQVYRATFKASFLGLGQKLVVYEYRSGGTQNPILINVTSVPNNQSTKDLSNISCNPLPSCTSQSNQILSLLELQQNLTLNRLQAYAVFQFAPYLTGKHLMYFRKRNVSDFKKQLSTPNVEVYELVYANIQKMLGAKIVLAIDLTNRQAYVVQNIFDFQVSQNLLKLSETNYGVFQKRMLNVNNFEIIETSFNSQSQTQSSNQMDNLLKVRQQFHSEIQSFLKLTDGLLITDSKFSVLFNQSQLNLTQESSRRTFVLPSSKILCINYNPKIQNGELLQQQSWLRSAIQKGTGNNNVSDISVLSITNYLNIYLEITVKYKSYSRSAFQRFAFQVQSSSLLKYFNPRQPENTTTLEISELQKLMLFNSNKTNISQLSTPVYLSPDNLLHAPKTFVTLAYQQKLLTHSQQEASKNITINKQNQSQVQNKTNVQQVVPFGPLITNFTIIPLYWSSEQTQPSTLSFLQPPKYPQISSINLISSKFGLDATVIAQRRSKNAGSLAIFTLHKKYGRIVIQANMKSKQIKKIIYTDQGYYKQGESLAELENLPDAEIKQLQQQSVEWINKVFSVYNVKYGNKLTLIFWKLKHFNRFLLSFDAVYENQNYSIQISIYSKAQINNPSNKQFLIASFNTSQIRLNNPNLTFQSANQQPKTKIIGSVQFSQAERLLSSQYGHFVASGVIVDVKLEQLFSNKIFIITYLMNENNIIEGSVVFNTVTKTAKVLSVVPLWANKLYKAPPNCKIVGDSQGCLRCFDNFILQKNGACESKLPGCYVQSGVSVCLNCLPGFMSAVQNRNCI